MRANVISVTPPQTRAATGILLSANVSASSHDLLTVRIAQDGETYEAFALPSDALSEALNEPLTAHALQFVQNDSSANAMPVLIGISVDPFADGFTHLPETLCPVEGVVLGIKRLVADIQTLPLRQFLMRVFQRRDVFRSFWTMPASAKHHHSRPGGLAVHSLEVANDVASHGQLSALEMDLGVAGALLHDVGKVWSYQHDMTPNAASLAMGHELIGLCKLEPELSMLETLWPDGAYAMRCLLSGHTRMRANGSIPSSLLPRIKACDQRSCEQDLRHDKRSANKPWVPQPWRDNGTAEDRAAF